MSEFNVGDKFRLVKLDDSDRKQGYSVGDVLTVKSADSEKVWNDSGWYFYYDEIELVEIIVSPSEKYDDSRYLKVIEKKTLSKFNVGDKFRLVKLDNIDLDQGYSVGDVLTVKSADSEKVSNGGGWYFYYDEIELVVTPSEFVVTEEKTMTNKTEKEVKKYLSLGVNDRDELIHDLQFKIESVKTYLDLQVHDQNWNKVIEVAIELSSFEAQIKVLESL